MYLNSFSKTKHYAQKYVTHRNICFIFFPSYYSLKILPAKPLGCSSFFVRLSKGHAHFPNDQIRIPWMPMRTSMLFFVVECLKSRLGKPASKSVDGRYASFSIRGKKPTSPVHKAIINTLLVSRPLVQHKLMQMVGDY